MAGPYYTNNKIDDVNVIEAADLEAIETGFSNVDTDKANKLVPATTNDLAGLSATGDLVDSGKTPPTGEIVGTTDTQTLTNKTLTSPTLNTATASGGTYTGITLDAPTIVNGWTEEIFTSTGTGDAFDTADGSVWDYTMTGNATFTDSLSNGESITLILRDGDTYTFTPPAGSIWVNTAAPTLTANDLIVMIKVGSVLIFQYVGEVTA